MVTEKLRICMVDSAMGNDYTFRLCSGLESSGMKISLVVPEDREVDFEVKFKVIKLAPTKKSSVGKFNKLIKHFNYLIRLYRYIMKHEFDVVHFQFFRRIEMDTLFFLFLRLTGKKLVYTVHDVSPLNRRKLDNLLYLIVYKTAGILIVHSLMNKQMLLEKVQNNPEKIKVVPHGNFNNYLPPNPLSKDEAREYFGLNSNEKVLLFFGFIKEYKGLDVLLEALAIATESIGNLTLIIAGQVQSEKLINDYKKAISKLPKNVKVIYHFEFIQDYKVANYFVASDVLVLPYRIISHSGVLHIAYSFGRAIIATRVGDFEEFIEDGKSGILTNSNDSAGVAKAIIRFYSDSENVERMCSNARNLNDTKYSWTNIALSMKEIYQQLKS